MLKIIKDREIVEDSWLHLQDDEPLVSGQITVSIARWKADKEQIQQLDGTIGVRLTGEDVLQDLVPDLSYFSLIVLFFPQFTDGRGYSYARLLRERYGFKGEIRAQGDVGQDQLFYLSQCGFNSFELSNPEYIEGALSAFDEFTESYQSTVLRPEPLYRRR